MRLIRLYIADYNVLKDLTIDFSASNADYQRGYDIDFLVGLNGSGKSTILRVLVEIFLRLENNSGEQTKLPFGFTLEYSIEIGDQERRIVITNLDEQQPNRLKVHQDGEEIDYDNKLLPISIVILTTGQESDWQEVEKLLSQRTLQIPLSQDPNVADQIISERVGRVNTRKSIPDDIGDDDDVGDVASRHVTFIRTSQLPLIMLSGLLEHEQRRSLLSQEPLEGFADVLRKSNIRGLKGFSFRFRIDDPFTIESIVSKLYHKCQPTRVLRLGNERLFVFDIADSSERRSAEILAEFGGGFQMFLALAELSRSRNPDDNVLQEVSIFFERGEARFNMRRDAHVIEELVVEPLLPLHLFGWLSDGEQSFLGRMALLALMNTQQGLILLDEPEVHFNDYWKRHIVNLIHGTLRGSGSHVLITTHSSITLTDVPKEDIVKIARHGAYTTGHPIGISIPTLAADPSDIMVHVFETDYATGERAVRQVLDLVKPGSFPNEERIRRLERLQGDIAPGYWSYLVKRAIGNGSEV